MSVPPPVTFDYANWVATFPELSAVSQQLAQSYFLRANLYCSNSVCNPAISAGVTPEATLGILPMLLDLVTAHLAWLYAPRDANGNPASTGQPASSLVGRINSASQGSVSVGIELNSSGSPSEAWFTQTKYGFEYWAATAQFRTARYMANPTFVPSTVFPYPRGVRWGR